VDSVPTARAESSAAEFSVRVASTGLLLPVPRDRSIVEVLRDGRPRLTTGPITVEAVPRLLNALAAGVAERELAAGDDVMAPQRRLLIERCGMADPYDIADALRHGAYAAFARALEDGQAAAVIEEVRAAGLTGRGGHTTCQPTIVGR